MVHIQDVVAHWSLQKTAGSTAENGEQNILDNYLSQVMTTNILVNGDTKVDSVSQWTLERFPHP